MSVAGDLAREAFRWLEDQGFRYVGEDHPLPLYSTSTFERASIAVLVNWDPRDGMTWTVLARGNRRLRWLPGRQLGLGHLDPGPRIADVRLPDPAVDPGPLREALAADSHLLQTRGARLLDGDHAAWAELARLQKASVGLDPPT